MEEDETEQPSPEALARYMNMRRHTFAPDASVEQAAAALAAAVAAAASNASSGTSTTPQPQPAQVSTARSTALRRGLHRLPAVIPEHSALGCSDSLSRNDSSALQASDNHDMMDLSAACDGETPNNSSTVTPHHTPPIPLVTQSLYQDDVCTVDLSRRRASADGFSHPQAIRNLVCAFLLFHLLIYPLLLLFIFHCGAYFRFSMIIDSSESPFLLTPTLVM